MGVCTGSAQAGEDAARPVQGLPSQWCGTAVPVGYRLGPFHLRAAIQPVKSL